MTTAKPGSLLCIDDGSYSGYGVTGFFVALQEFSPDAMLAEFLRANPAQREPYRFKASAFLAFLLSRGLLLEIQYGDLYMGDGHSADVRFTPLERPSGGEGT